MKRNWLLILLVMAFLAALPFVQSGCGDDDDDDDNDTGGNITPPVDDDQSPADDDDTGPDDDDTTPDDDDDDDNDNDNDNNDDNDTDVQYESIYCAIPDPESIGDGLSIGGGQLSGTLTVYVYSDKDCSAIAGASVIAGDATVETNEDGKATITITDKAAVLVTAYKSGYQAWSYQADAAVMYFRLCPADYGVTYNSTSSGEFYENGQAMELTNPAINGIGELLNLLNQPIYLGLALPNICRKSFFSLDLYSVITELTYQIDIDTPMGGYYMVLWHNVYAPALAINNVLGITLSMTDHAFYQFPKNPDATLFPYGAFLLDADLGAVLNLQTLTELIQEWLNTGDITQAILALVPSLIADGMTIINAGLDPEYDGVAEPNLETADLLAKGGFTATIDNPATDADYLGLFLAEVPNRILTPLTITMADENGDMAINSTDFVDSDYILAAAKTNLFSSSFDSSDISIQFQYGQETSRWASGAEFAEADFLPYFDAANTTYNPVSKTIAWQLGGDKAAADAYFLLVLPINEGQPTIAATLPGDVESYTIPPELNYSPSYDDTVFLFAIDLPDEVDTNSWDPFSILAYDSAAISMWVNRPLIDVLMEWFDPDR